MKLWAAWAALLIAGHAQAGSAPAGMAWIPPGSWQPLTAPTGSAAVKVRGYYLDVRPVTNAEYLAFVTAVPQWRRSRVSPLFAEAGYLADWEGDLDPGPRAPSGSPVVRVSWFAARAYANWRGRRLPTVAEWERAASAGFTSARGGADPVYRQAALRWYSTPLEAHLPPAGSGRPNYYGVRDLVGLVWEWTEDFNTAAISQGAACAGSAEDVRDFSDYPAFMRAAFRGSLSANYVVPGLGFRCALSGPGPSGLTARSSPSLPGSGRSLYQLGATWTDDANAPFRLARLRGHPVVIAMIYTRCGYACPLLVEQLKQLERALPARSRRDVRFVLVSFDAKGDTPQVLRAYRERTGLSADSWILLHGDPGPIRELGMALGVNYSEVAPGLFSHSSLVTVLNSEGDIVLQRPGLANGMAETLRAVGEQP